MKRFAILCVVLAICIGSMKSQVITITFESTLTGAPTPLDSILVMNLAQGGDTTIYFPDNVLVLGATGISEAGSAGLSIQGLPNPFAGSTEVVLEANGGMALLALHDVTGRELVSYTANLAAGAHRFRVSCERPGVHLLTMVQRGGRSSLRLVATEGAGVAGLLLLGGSDRVAPKSDRALFNWNHGDELRYIGYATSEEVLFSAAIDEIPVASATRTFVMAAGAACPDSPTVIDIDGNVYPAVQIGDQCWMAANLKTIRYRDGTTIPNVTDNMAWTQLTSGAWSIFSFSPVNDATYGKLYNWYVAADPDICPQGWHVPTDAEWQQLELALGIPSDELNSTGLRGAAQNVGTKMKATTLWVPPNTGATNESGFSGLPGGYRHGNHGSFMSIGHYGYWWSASENEAEFVWLRFLFNYSTGVGRIITTKSFGCYLRCVRD